MAMNIDIIRQTLEQIGPLRAELRHRFYETLFALHPRLESVLRQEDRDNLRSVFFEGLEVLDTYFDSPDQLETKLVQLGAKYRQTLLKTEYLPVFREVVLQVLGEMLAPEWNSDMESAWDEALGLGITMMLRDSVTAE